MSLKMNEKRLIITLKEAFHIAHLWIEIITNSRPHEQTNQITGCHDGYRQKFGDRRFELQHKYYKLDASVQYICFGYLYG